MQNREIARQLQRLKDLIKRTTDACGDNPEAQSDWAKYICVLSAGLIENALKEIYIEYAYRTVSEPVARFASSHISPIRNPKTDKFIEIAAAFKEEWKIELENFVTLDGRGDALDSLINQRHLIAHGKERDSHLSIVQVKEYLEKTIEVIEFVENQCIH